MKDTRYFWCTSLRILWILFPALDGVELFQKYECEGKILNLNCTDGVVLIHDAIYGRNNSDYCPGQRSQNYGQPCISNKSRSIVEDKCVNKSSCSINAANRLFGDPCHGVFKYLEVDYTCDINDIPCSCERANEMCKETSTEVICMCKPNYQRDSLNICREHYNTSIIGLRDLAKINITEDNVEFVAEQLEKATSDGYNWTSEQVAMVVDIFSGIIQVKYPSHQVTTSLISATNNLMELSRQVIENVTEVGSIPSMLEEQVKNLLSLEDNYTEIMSNVGCTALQVSPLTFTTTNISFGSNFAQTVYEGNRPDLSWNNTHVYFNNTAPKDFISMITLSTAFLNSIERGNLTQRDIPISFFIFKNDKLFPMQTTKISGSLNVLDVISSQVISASVAMDGTNIHNLLPNKSVLTRFYSFPVKISTSADENKEGSCVYWKYNSTLGRGKWDTYGCKMVQSDEHYVTCLCNHLTSFAVLVRVTKEPYTSNPILDFVSVIGRILSIIGLSICVVTSLAIKEIRRKQLTQIHIHLSIALIALYATFSIGIKSTRDDVRCQITASLIHFFCFSSMAWMSVEAFNMFVFLWTMRRDNIKHLLLIGSLYAWGFPLIVSTTVYLLDESIDYRGVSYCFLQPGIALYIGFLLPILLLFIFNCVIFVLITYRVSCRKIIAANEEARRKAEMARIKGPILFWILLGLSWMFGILAIFNTSIKVLFEILFSVCLSLQGVFMFYMLTLNNPEIKTKLKRFRQLFTEAFERSITSQLHLRSFTTDQQVDVKVESQTGSTNDII